MIRQRKAFDRNASSILTEQKSLNSISIRKERKNWLWMEKPQVVKSKLLMSAIL